MKKEAYQGYEKGLMMLAKLKGRGLCDFEYDSIYEPYELHGVFVTWTQDNNGFAEMDAKVLAALIQQFDTIHLDKQEPFTWLLSSRIFFEG